ncbi:MAG: tetratricopeptide repeat protein [Candidatus Riflebacteria bacterium]|nr:tetratricopeptide repeat protein [Candidatus Riflebacteria bacterium]
MDRWPVPAFQAGHRPTLVLPEDLSVGREAETLFNRGVYTTDVKEQIEVYTKALKLDPGLPMGHHNLGAAYYRLGMFDRAVEVLEMALIASPYYPNTHYLLACCHARLGQSQQAVSSLRKAVRYGWHESDMVRADTDFDSIRSSPEFPRLSSRSGGGKKGSASGRRRARRGKRKSGGAATAGPAPGGPSIGGPGGVGGPGSPTGLGGPGGLPPGMNTSPTPPPSGPGGQPMTGGKKGGKKGD